MKSIKPNFHYIDHTADMGIAVYGTDLKSLFEEAAKSMIYIMIGDASPDKTKRINVSVAGDDLPDLMVRWLGEILYLFEGEREIVTDIGIDYFTPSRLHATLTTTSYNPDVHNILCEIKAVTYHQIEVDRNNSGYSTKIIFDL
ncbi:MAG: archease [Deltaproteobacteria bacterium]|nr:archease [Deltaproteobacteria bacterium]